MELIKVDIGSKMNLTLLAKAYWDNLFPLATYGELFYEEDLTNDDFPVQFLFFKEEYYNKLTTFFNEIQTLDKIQRSNSPNEWIALINTIKYNQTKISKDIGLINVYTPSTTNYETITIDDTLTNEILNKKKVLTNDIKIIIKEITLDLKRIYWGVNMGVSRFEKGKGIYISIPITEEKIQRFPYGPIIKLLDKYDQQIEDINLFKGKNNKEINISITIKNWDI